MVGTLIFETLIEEMVSLVNIIYDTESHTFLNNTTNFNEKFKRLQRENVLNPLKIFRASIFLKYFVQDTIYVTKYLL